MLITFNDVLVCATSQVKPVGEKKGFNSYLLSYKDDKSNFYKLITIYDRFGDYKLNRKDYLEHIVLDMSIGKENKTYFNFVESMEQKPKKV